MFEKLLNFIVENKVYFNNGGKNGYLENIGDSFPKYGNMLYYFKPNNLVFTHSMVESITFGTNGATVKFK
jgi:hypothetical protein